MTQRPTPMPTGETQNGSEQIGRKIGLGILAVIVLLVSVWLYVQGKRSGAPSPTAPLAALTNVDATRFRADAWYLPKDSLLGFVEIPAGPFLMGSDPNIDPMAFENERWSDQLEQGTVELPMYYIGRFEVTVAQYAAFVTATGHKTELPLGTAPDHPVSNVSWTDALAYGRWLESQLKESTQTPTLLSQRLRDGWHITLPNEAQWEKAARGTDGRIFPWGNAPSREHANFGSAGTTSVGRFDCSPCTYSLADMSGNVWELTRSTYQPYPFNTGTPDLQAKALYVMRGGSFSDTDGTIRAAVRGGIDPGARRPFIGFRLVLSPN